MTGAAMAYSAREIRMRSDSQFDPAAVLLGFRNSARSLEIVLDAMPVAVSWANLSDLKILFTNRMFTELFGYQASELGDILEWVEKVYPFEEDRALVAARWGMMPFSADLTERTIEPCEIRLRCRDGSMRTVIHSGVILPEPGWAVAIFVDITDRKHDELVLQAAERIARENEAVYRLLLDHAPEMIVLSHLDGSPSYVSPAVTEITGFSAYEYLRRKTEELIHPEDRTTVELAIENIREGNLTHVFRYRTLQKDGSYRWVESTTSGYVDPVSQRPAGYVSTIRDISEQKRREDRLATERRQLSEAASLDELTGIPNRRTFNQSLLREARRQTRTSRDLCLLLLDVDRFKQYNDLYGHPAGDVCLRRIAETVKETLQRSSDLVARYGGEEFAVLLPMTELPGAVAVAGNILRAIAGMGMPHPGSGHGVVTVSIGVSCWPAKPGLQLNQELLVQQADRALYRAKGDGRNCFRVAEADEAGAARD